MSRKYRVKYPCLERNDGPYKPITITVNLMTGISYTLCTENDNETFLDVKTVLRHALPHGTFVDRLVFMVLIDKIDPKLKIDAEKAGAYYVVSNNTTVSSWLPPLKNDEDRFITLELVIKWNEEEELLFLHTSTENDVEIHEDIFSNPFLKQVAIEGLKYNHNMTSLEVASKDTMFIMEIIRLLPGNETLKNLSVTILSVHFDMTELFDIISRRNVEIPNGINRYPPLP